MLSVKYRLLSCMTAIVSAIIAVTMASSSLAAVNITPTSDANALAAALIKGQGVTVVSATLTGAEGAAGTYIAGPLGLSDGIVMSSGLVSQIAGSLSDSLSTGNQTPGTALCNTLTTPFGSFDAITLEIQFNLAAGYQGISLEYMFGSEEYPEYVGDDYNDSVGLFIDGTNVAKDADGNTININGPFFAGGNVITTTGTPLDGSTPRLVRKIEMAAGDHSMIVVVCDAGDSSLDSAAFFSALVGCVENCNQVTWCGNGTIEEGEDCDDGNNIDSDGCNNTCEIAVCGDGEVSGYEECDDGDLETGDGCSDGCTIEYGYTCDPGSPSVCYLTCGDGAVQSWEQCDDGDVEPEDGCAADCTVEPGYSCTGSPSQCVFACGNGVWDDGEYCDDGNLEIGDGCSDTCTVEPGWECFWDEWSYCFELCGNGYWDEGEECDDYNTESGDGCSSTCSIEPGWECFWEEWSYCYFTCGDGEPGMMEQCDDGNNIDGDGCDALCNLEEGWNCVFVGQDNVVIDFCLENCGDGLVVGLEACDDSGESAACNANCTFAICGDGQINQTAGETCETEGDTLICDSNCTGVVCGDGYTNEIAGEECDTGVQSATCDANCTNPVCGDGTLNTLAGEGCDDNNTNDGDGCNSVCVSETCGDGITNNGEPCDDANLINTDACLVDCIAASCGDGWIHTGVEVCDDANATGEDGCTQCQVDEGWECVWNEELIRSVCTLIDVDECGNGEIEGNEVCDDGDTDAGDGCSATCTVEEGWTCTGEPSVCTEIVTDECGNGEIEGEEVCDDGDTDAGDGCSATCTVEEGWTCTGEPSVCAEIVTDECGNGEIEGEEVCDDGDNDAGDGCSATCTVEEGWTCTGEPSVCTEIVIMGCGNGTIEDQEECDDGNMTSGDGCSNICDVEDGWICDTAEPTGCDKDTDDDGVIDDEDNCPTTPNKDQLDSDDNGIGDACEEITGDVDTDGDGILDENDNCPEVPNKNQNDWNGNGIGDVCEDIDYEFTGGTNCSASATTSSGAAAGSAVLVAGLLLGLFFIRRRRPFGVRSAATSILLAATLWSGAASAQQLDVQAFHPSPFMQDQFAVQTGETKGDYLWNVGLFLNAQFNPLVLRQTINDDDEIVRVIVSDQITGNILGSYRILDWLAVGLDIPVTLWQHGKAIDGSGEFDNMGLGDIRLVPRVRILSAWDNRFALGLTAAVSFPTGQTGGDYMGRSGVGFNPTLAASLNLGSWGGAVNVGMLFASADEIGNAELSHELQVNAGAWVGIVPRTLDLLAEVRTVGQLTSPYGDVNESPTEVLGGLKWHIIPGLDASLGAGVGLTTGIGSPDLRVFGGVMYSYVEDEKPVEKDTDGDGYLDSKDSCPLDPEDFDKFEDQEGCPDADNDKDGVLDPWVAQKGKQDKYAELGTGSDSCPDVPEDKDGFEDADGCPDPDNDKDTFCDPWVEKHPNPAQAGKGCKGVDQCPDKPETVNEFEDEDGCPDEKPVVIVQKEKIVILEKVEFYLDETRILESSMPLLDKVAQVLIDNPQIKLVRVEGHTDARGTEARNKWLGDGRAKVVRDYLIGKGVDGKRLVSKGYGSSKPLIPNAQTEEEHQKNRRVEFIILEQDEKQP